MAGAVVVGVALALALPPPPPLPALLEAGALREPPRSALPVPLRAAQPLACDETVACAVALTVWEAGAEVLADRVAVPHREGGGVPLAQALTEARALAPAVAVAGGEGEGVAVALPLPAPLSVTDAVAVEVPPPGRSSVRVSIALPESKGLAL